MGERREQRTKRQAEGGRRSSTQAVRQRIWVDRKTGRAEKPGGLRVQVDAEI